VAKTKFTLCKIDGCRLEERHTGKHSKFPTNVWNFLGEKDKKKIIKAGFATPRGGSKGAYQNHVSRSSQVIIPYEKLKSVDLSKFKNGYVVRLYPDQCFDKNGQVRPELASENVVIDQNAFVLYRSHESLKKYPPHTNWEIRNLLKDGKKVERRGKDVSDAGHYVLRIPAQSPDPELDKGYPQGIFAPEYADEETNFLCQVFLVWLITKTKNNPYNTTNLDHIEAILSDAGILDKQILIKNGLILNDLTTCPLCMKVIKYEQLHEMLEMEDEERLANAGQQVSGTTRSTEVNLFHIRPLFYSKLEHMPKNVGWGHASCNTKLGQTDCISVDELQSRGKPVLLEGKELVGWISDDTKIIRSSKGETWIKISDGKED